ncbi:type ISP restriction/modification enzyme [Bacteroidota bacterium]
MKKAKIYYFTLTDEMRKEEKLAWFSEMKFNDIPFEHIQPDKNSNWINLTDNDWDEMIPTINYDVKHGNISNTIFKIFSNGIATNRDFWVYDINKDDLINKVKHFIRIYNDLIKTNNRSFPDIIKWSHAFKKKFLNGKKLIFDENKITQVYYRPFKIMYYYCDFDMSDLLTSTHFVMHGANLKNSNQSIWFKCGITSYFFSLGINKVTDIMPNGGSKCLPLYRYDESGNKLENITDWGLKQFRSRYEGPPSKKRGLGGVSKSSDNTPGNSHTPLSPIDRGEIQKEDVFYYTYGVLHNPAYRKKYELNLKREFPRLPFYENFYQWRDWGKQLMDLHIGFEQAEKFPLELRDTGYDKAHEPKAKLRANKEQGIIILDEQTELHGIPKEAWDYKLGNRSALEWIIDQYKEKKPRDPTIREKFNTYRFADYKDKVIELLMRVTTVSIETVKIVREMEK